VGERKRLGGGPSDKLAGAPNAAEGVRKENVVTMDRGGEKRNLLEKKGGYYPLKAAYRIADAYSGKKKWENQEEADVQNKGPWPGTLGEEIKRGVSSKGGKVRL